MSRAINILIFTLLLSSISYLGFELYQEDLAEKEIISRRLESLKKFDYDSVELESLEKLNLLDKETIEKGKNEAKKHKIIFTGITRDNFDDFFITAKHLEYIGSFFSDYRVIIFENDSVDGTKEALAKWVKKNKKVRVISKDFNLEKKTSHKFMAEIRNEYLKSILTSEYEDFDLLIAIDQDMSHGVDVRGIFDSLAKVDQWDVVCANGIANKKGKMYDAYAFRSQEFPFSPSKWHEICLSSITDNNSYSWKKICDKGDELSHGVLYDLLAFRYDWRKSSRLYWLKIVPQIQKIYPIDNNLVEVNSCFGGLAIYKKNILANCFYDSLSNDCEHVGFHRCLKEKNHAKIFLNPNMVIRYSHYTRLDF